MRIIDLLLSIRFTKFVLVGGFVAAIGALLMYIFVDVMAVEKNLAFFLQLFIALQICFVLNDRFTWMDIRGLNGTLKTRWLKFHLARIISIVLEQGLFGLLIIMNVYYMIAYMACSFVGMTINYFAGDLFVFSKKTKQLK